MGVMGKDSMMEEQAKKELEMLEAQYPNQYEYLKQELRSFIFHLQSNHHDSPSHLLPENNHFNTSSVFLDTEESTSLEQTKGSNYGLQLALPDREVSEGKTAESSELESPKSVVAVKHYPSRKNKRKDRVDLVIKRAQNCLKKIRHLKTTLLLPS